jgi:hypothetical protein
LARIGARVAPDPAKPARASQNSDNDLAWLAHLEPSASRTNTPNVPQV